MLDETAIRKDSLVLVVDSSRRAINSYFRFFPTKNQVPGAHGRPRDTPPPAATGVRGLVPVPSMVSFDITTLTPRGCRLNRLELRQFVIHTSKVIMIIEQTDGQRAICTSCKYVNYSFDLSSRSRACIMFSSINTKLRFNRLPRSKKYITHSSGGTTCLPAQQRYVDGYSTHRPCRG